MTRHGECFCGAVAYRIEGALIKPRCCHCSRCRKAFSGAGSAYAELGAGALVWTRGESHLQYYGDRKRWAIVFCRTCGSRLCGVYEDEIHGVCLGGLDDAENIAIEYHCYVDSKAPWDEIGGAAPQFEGAYQAT